MTDRVLRSLRRFLCSHRSTVGVSDDYFYVTKCSVCGKVWADVLGSPEDQRA